MSTTCSDIALADVAGPMKDLLDKLSGENGASWLEAVKLVLRTQPHLLIAKLKELALKLWKKLPVGGNTKDELLEKFKTATYRVGNEDKVGIQASDWARDIASKPECVFPTEVEDGVEFVMGSLGDLFGFKKNTETQFFLNEDFLAKHNLEFCKPSDAFYLRLNYTDQPLDEWIRVGMKPIIDSGRDPNVFSLEHGSRGVWLSADYAYPVYQWFPDNLWVFRRKVAKP
ncbi:MAG: hypothetical protein QG568_551 [Patescibacteria group bacterium]|nr:hypothetical protein [Patescibacteria group bacterium]